MCIAVLDGPVDLGHACFEGAALTVLGPSSHAADPYALAHGTHIASVIFGQHRGGVAGIAPRCRGVLVPIFGAERGEARCSQLELAHAIRRARAHGADIINISGGELVRPVGTELDPLLVEVIRDCVDAGVLVVAAAGNDSCECQHVPAALPGVLAVGALRADDSPIDSSNWGPIYRSQGLLAPGEKIVGAAPGGGTAAKTGTSFAAPVVAGVAALLMSLQRRRQTRRDGRAIRAALLQSARPRSSLGLHADIARDRYLAGILDIAGARAFLAAHTGEQNMSDPEQSTSPESIHQAHGPITQDLPPMTVHAGNSPTCAHVIPSEGCAACSAKSAAAVEAPSGPRLVYALGQLDAYFTSQASQDSFAQVMAPNASLAEHLRSNPHEAEAVHWVLLLDGTPIYGIRPVGAYAHVAYQRLHEFLSDKDVERVSIPGRILGTGTLRTGQVVPVIAPEVRGMYSWSSKALLDTLVPGEDKQGLRGRVEDFLSRVYHDFRTLGMEPRERALNYAATNALQARTVLSQALQEGRVLQTITVEKSPISRPNSDCYDVKLRFFDPENMLRAKRVFRYTIDVSDVIPVNVGPVRSWSEG